MFFELSEKNLFLFKSLQNRSINIGYIIDNPYSNNCTDPSDTLECPLPGLAVEFAAMVCSFLNFRCRFSPQNHTNYGIKINETFDGLIGQLIDNEFDVLIPSISPSTDRSGIIDLGVPVFIEQQVMFTRYPQINLFGVDSLIFSFSWQLWLLVFATMLILGSIAAGIDLIKFDGSIKERWEKSMKSKILSVIGIFTAQGKFGCLNPKFWVPKS